MTVQALVALGSNLSPRRQTLQAAVGALSDLAHTRLVATSTFCETAPLDCPPGSGSFLNGAVLLTTDLAPDELLTALLAIEVDHGRSRASPGHGLRHAPRTLDLDLIVHGDTLLSGPSLTLPHPAAHQRLFVLNPAAELLPDALHPSLGRTWTQLRDELLEA